MLTLLCVLFSSAKNVAAAEDWEIPESLSKLFAKFDHLGRGVIQDATFVELTFQVEFESYGDKPGSIEPVTETGWLLDETDEFVEVLKADLTPWVYPKSSRSSRLTDWFPRAVRFESFAEVDYRTFCEDYSRKRRIPPTDVSMKIRRSNGLTTLLIAHAAWKKGLRDVIDEILTCEPEFYADYDSFEKRVLEELSVCQLRRSLALLTHGKQGEAIEHLKLVPRVTLESEFSKQAIALVADLKMFENKPPNGVADDDEVTNPPESASGLVTIQRDVVMVGR